jgi:hypothetical protein
MRLEEVNRTPLESYIIWLLGVMKSHVSNHTIDVHTGMSQPHAGCQCNLLMSEGLQCSHVASSLCFLISCRAQPFFLVCTLAVFGMLVAPKETLISALGLIPTRTRC